MNVSTPSVFVTRTFWQKQMKSQLGNSKHFIFTARLLCSPANVYLVHPINVGLVRQVSYLQVLPFPSPGLIHSYSTYVSVSFVVLVLSQFRNMPVTILRATRGDRQRDIVQYSLSQCTVQPYSKWRPHGEQEHNVVTGQVMVSDRIWTFGGLLQLKTYGEGWVKKYKSEPDRQNGENALKISKQELN